MATIRVAADIIHNTNLVRLPANASRPIRELPLTSLREDIGGACISPD